MTDDQFPRGKLAEDDEGTLEIRVFEYRGETVINFGKQISWIGMAPEQALHVSELSWHTDWHAYRFSGRPLHGTGYPHFRPQFYTAYRVEKCRHCPHAETALFVKDTYRLIDEINARFL